MALARYFHTKDMDQVRRLKTLLIPVAIIAAPFLLVAAQPDLGTGMSIVIASVTILFAAGVSIWIFIAGVAAAAAAVPIAWNFLLHDYQKDRVRIFLDRNQIPWARGFTLPNRKLPLGSGGITGKGS